MNQFYDRQDAGKSKFTENVYITERKVTTVSTLQKIFADRTRLGSGAIHQMCNLDVRIVYLFVTQVILTRLRPYQLDKVHVVHNASDNTWILCDANNDGDEGAIFRVQGIVCGKMLPPVSRPA